MAVPKKKTSKSRKGMRRSHDKIAAPNVIYCECGEPTLPPPRLLCLRHLQGSPGH